MARKKPGALSLKLAAGMRFRWQSPPAHNGTIVKPLPDGRAEVRIEGQTTSQTWYVGDVERWLRLGLMIWN